MRLLHRERVTVSPLDRSGVRMDALRAEPTAHRARLPSVQLAAQVEEDRRTDLQATQGGGSLQEAAVLTFRLRDVLASGWEPGVGDEVTEIADPDGSNPRAVRWWVVEAHRSGKRPRGRAADLVVVRALTRSPARPAVQGL